MLRYLTIAMLVVSVLGIILSIVLVGRESRLKPRFDVARIVIMGAVAAVMTFAIDITTPTWALGAALGGGIVIGTLQGRNLTVRSTDKGLYARRTTVAVFAFIAGLAVTQVAGYLKRTGAIQVGVAMTVLSVAVAVGLLVGRQPRVRAAKAEAQAEAVQ